MTEPSIEQRFLLLAFALMLGCIFTIAAWSKGFFRLKPPQASPIQFRDVLKVFCFFLAVEVLLIPLLGLVWHILKSGQFHMGSHPFPGVQARGWFNLITICTASLAVIIYCLLLESNKRDDIVWGGEAKSTSRVFQNLMFGAFTWMMSYPYVMVIGQIAGILGTVFGAGQHTEQVAVKHLRDTMQYPVMFAFTVFSIVFLVPAAEEILFRGFLQKWLANKWGRIKAIALTSIIFALFHFSFSQKWDNIELMASLFLLSCFLGFIYERQRTLWAPFGLHMTFNIVSVAIILTTGPASLFGQALEIDEEIKEAPPTKEMLASFMQATVQGNNTFAFDLYRLLKNTGGNFCFSPYAISSAVALPFSGARGVTQSDMRIAMHYLNQVNQVLGVFATFDKLYTTPWYLGSNESRLFLGNSLWLSRSIQLLPSFLESLPNLYRGAVKQVDFLRNPEAARGTINQYVKEKTQGRVPAQVDKGDVTQATQMAIVSSMFMKGVWETPFNPQFSKEAPFFIDVKNTGSAEMMLTSGRFRIYQTDEFMLLELPFRPDYRGVPHLALMILLPTKNFALASLEEKFYVENWNSWVSRLKEEGVVVMIPSFKILQSFNLTEALGVLGMRFAYSSQADFSGISNNQMQLSSVLHAVQFGVDEKGSEAISANPISIHQQSNLSEQQARAFNANHPFSFAVMDKTNNMIILMGRFIKP